MRLRPLAFVATLLFVLCAPRSWSEEGHSISEPLAVAPRDSLRDPNARRTLAFTPAPLERCDGYLVLEAAVAQVNVEANDWLDDHLVRNSIGYMKNVSPNRSLGGSLDLWWLQGTIAAAPTVRARQWFGRRQSVEASAGWVLNDRDGAVGPIAALRYSPHPAFTLEGGVCTVQQEQFQWGLGAGLPLYRYTKRTSGFAGVGVSGGGGVVVWAAEAVAIVGIGIMLMGMDD